MNNSRFYFIDITRGIAILMMLQGHFISLTFADYESLSDAFRQSGSSGSVLFDGWFLLRGFTAPLFFTISGTVYLFVLSGDTEGSYWKRKRVRKGIKRGFYLVLLGYILQLSFKNIHIYLDGRINERFFAFHVLHSIGLGIILMTVCYFLMHKLKQSYSIALFIILGAFFFLMKPLITEASDPYFPAGSISLVQNLFNGPNSVFPIFPWFGYIFSGAAIGILYRKYRDQVHTLSFRRNFILVALTIIAFMWIVFYVAGLFVQGPDLHRPLQSLFHLACVVSLLGTTMWVEGKFGSGGGMLSAVGRNTLSIYFLHAIILYGALTGFGIKTWMDSSLTIPQVLVGTVLFIGFFVGLTWFQPLLKRQIRQLSSRR